MNSVKEKKQEKMVLWLGEFEGYGRIVDMLL